VSVLVAVPLDEVSAAFYLQVTPELVVLLQGYFDLYEGLGIVRTVDTTLSRVAIVTTQALEADCARALEALRAEVPWEPLGPEDVPGGALGAA